jgi:hypothetical protein
MQQEKVINMKDFMVRLVYVPVLHVSHTVIYCGRDTWEKRLPVTYLFLAGSGHN